MTSRVLAVTNQKGGVGKTTTAVNLGAALGSRGHSVLVVDLDPQGNASTGLGWSRDPRLQTTYDVLVERAPMHDAIGKTEFENVSLAPGTLDLSSVDVQLAREDDRMTRLRTALEELKASSASYDYVLIDCPPALNMLTINALVSASAVLVPLQAEFYALEGLSQLMVTIKEVRREANPSLRMEGVVLTMYDRRNRLSLQVEADARDTLGELVFQTVVPRNVRLGEAPSHGMPILAYDPHSQGSVAYLALADELMARHAAGLADKEHA